VQPGALRQAALHGQPRHHRGASLVTSGVRLPTDTGVAPTCACRGSIPEPYFPVATVLTQIVPSVPCRDVARRRREVLVEQLSDQRLMVTVPPGEIAEFAHEEAEAFRRVLGEAVPDAAAESSTAMTVFGAARYTVLCLDAMDRERAMIVFVRGRWVAVAASAGGVAVFDPLRLASLSAALRAAIGVSLIEAAIA